MRFANPIANVLRSRPSVATAWTFQGSPTTALSDLETAEIQSRSQHWRSLIFALGLALAMGCPMMASAGAEAPPAGSENQTLPAEIVGDRPADGAHQDAADLRRTRNLVYGLDLTSAQHVEIESWRPTDLDWWLAADRRERALDLVARLEDRVADLPAHQLSSGLAADPDFFGIEVELIRDAEGQPTGQVELLIAPEKRPDFFTLERTLEQLMLLFKASGSASNEAEHPSQVWNRPAFDDIFGHLPTAAEPAAWNELQNAFFTAVESYWMEHARSRSRLFESTIEPILSTYQGDSWHGYHLTLDEELNRQSRRNDAQALVDTFWWFMDQELPVQLRGPLFQELKERASMPAHLIWLRPTRERRLTVFSEWLAAAQDGRAASVGAGSSSFDVKHTVSELSAHFDTFRNDIELTGRYSVIIQPNLKATDRLKLKRYQSSESVLRGAVSYLQGPPVDPRLALWQGTLSSSLNGNWEYGAGDHQLRVKNTGNTAPADYGWQTLNPIGGTCPASIHEPVCRSDFDFSSKRDFPGFRNGPGRWKLSTRHKIWERNSKPTGLYQLDADIAASAEVSGPLALLRQEASGLAVSVTQGPEVTVTIPPVRLTTKDRSYNGSLGQSRAECPVDTQWDPAQQGCACDPSVQPTPGSVCSAGGAGTLPLDPVNQPIENDAWRTFVVTLPIGLNPIVTTTILVLETLEKYGVTLAGEECVEAQCPAQLLHLPAPRRACFDGDIWQPCADHPPYLAFVRPAGNFNHYFPPCFTSPSGAFSTPCSGGGTHAPDLIVDQARLVSTSAGAGDELVFEVGIRNLSGFAAANSSFGLRMTTPSGQTLSWSDWTGSLGAGAGRTFRFSSGRWGHQATVGAYQVTVTADTFSEIAEGREDNNEATLAFDVAALPLGLDLSAGPLFPSLNNPVVGELVSVGFDIRNSGSLTIGPGVDWAYSIEGPDGSVQTRRLGVGTLLPGQSKNKKVSVFGALPGRYEVTVAVDSEGVLTEVSENNNWADLDLVFTENNTCLPCTSGQPNNQVGDRLCFDGLSSGQPEDGDVWTCRGVRANGISCVGSGNHPNGWELTGPRCPDPSTLCAGYQHRDACGNAVCPGTRICF